MATEAQMEWRLISQGAEAKVYETVFAGRPCIVKERVKKSYRLPILDKKLSHRRLIQEARCIIKCRKSGVLTPCIYLIDEDQGRLYTEKICGGSVKEFLRAEWKWIDGEYSAAALKLSYRIGVAIAAMHNAEIVIIDFGLANSQPLPEDKAVDLYVMERAFNSTHVKSEVLVSEVLRAYKACSRRADSVFQKLSQVRLRGRKRTMVG
ncbi:TPA: hypothetical protein N0F65_000946 [Lagenidium giganteum]|uniref:non-specific serine/threonine protein kinase n=1 Tax=Lagenidium giganteum TaxID=4803 RepID=A0AAV2YKL5_9STRA|nr:TPA: hypothetical protein N0F65_000946 [Lagenidium giganteum]